MRGGSGTAGLLPTVALDLRVQANSGLFAVGLAVAAALGIASRLLLGPEHAGPGIPGAYLFMLSGTTLYFGASLLLLERSQGVLMALRVTPLSQRDYLASKLLTLVGFAMVEAIVLHAIGFWGATFDPFPLVAGLLLLGLTNTLIGIGMVVTHDSVLGFLMPGGMVIGALQTLPAIELIGLNLGPLRWVIPSEPALTLMRASTAPLSMGEWVFGVVGSLAWLLLTAVWAHRRFARRVALGGNR